MPESFLADVQKLRRVVIPPAVFKTLNLTEGETVRVTIEKLVSSVQLEAKDYIGGKKGDTPRA